MSGTGIVIGNFVGGATGGGAGSSAPPITPGFNPLIFKIDTSYIPNSNDYALGLDSNGTYDFTVTWGDGQSDVITSYNQPEVTHTYSSAGVRTITITPNQAYSVDHWSFGRRSSSIKSEALTDIISFGDVYFYANEDIFNGCSNFDTVSYLAGVPTFQNTVIIDLFFARNDSLGTTTEPDFSGWGTFTGSAASFLVASSAPPFTGSARVNVNFNFTPTSLSSAFLNQILFNSPLSNWTVSSVENFSNSFSGASSFNNPLPWTFNTSGTSNVLATSMFKDALVFNQDIGSWNTNRFTNTASMFRGALAFNQDIGAWNTDSIVDASYMFEGATAFNSGLSSWFTTGSLSNTSIVGGGVVGMFEGATAFNGLVSQWDTSNLISLYLTFRNATSFNQSLTLWDVSGVTFFGETFAGATSFTGFGLPGWDTSSATSFLGMFNGASAFNQDLSSWDISSLINASNMLTGTAISQANWDSLLNGWAAQAPNIQNNVTLSDIPVIHSAGKPTASYDRLTSSPYNWTITDLGGALPPPPFEFTIDTTATETGSSANDQYRLPLMSTGTYNFYVDWGDGTIGDQIISWNQAEATHTYATAGTYIIQILATAPVGETPSVDHISWASQNGTTLTAANDRLKVQGIAKWGSAQVYLNEYVFSDCSNLDITTTALPNFGSKVLRTSAFENCDSLSGNLSGWGTVSSPITGFGSLFYKDAASSNPNFNFVFQATSLLTQAFNNSTDFNNPLDNWDVSNASGFTQTFRNATSFNQDISGWDTGNSGAFNGMFIGASSFNQNISSWNVANATTFSQTFKNATSFNQPIGAWTTTSLTNLYETFSGATAFDQNLANWDVSGVTTATSMLTNSGISAANWDALLIGWAAQGTGAGSLQANVTLSNINQSHGSVDSAATAAYNKLTASPYNWTIVDLGGAPVGNLLLDTSYGSGAEAAYSVRKLRTAYTGPAIKVQDTVGGATQDIYFDANDNLDEAAIISYGGSNDVFVETWYDQSVNGNDAEQPSSTLRPKIYDGTTGAIVKNNGKAMLQSNSLTTGLFTTATGVNNSTFFGLIETNPTVSKIGAVFNGGNPSSDYLLLLEDGSTSTSFNVRSGTPTTYVNGVTGSFTRDSLFDFAANGSLTSVVNYDGSSYNYEFGWSTNTGIGMPSMQEAIIYPSAKSSTDQTSIEENIGDYFTQNTPLLGTYTGASAAYSLRLLDSTYTRSAVQVQDTVGGAAQDIGFNVFGELDTVALAAYGGSNDVFVATWYDQSGNSNDATMNSSGSRPKIYDGSTGVLVDANGKPIVEFTSTLKELRIPTAAASSTMFAFSVFKTNDLITEQGVYNFNGKGSISLNRNANGVICMRSGNLGASGTTATPHLVAANHGTAIFIDGAQATTSLSGRQSNNDSMGRVGGFRFDGFVQELILYASGTSDDADIQTNMNDFYQVY